MPNFRQILMKHLLVSSAAALCFIASSAKGNSAHHYYFQQPTDSIPSNIIPRVQVTVKDLQDGTLVDSAYVVAGKFKGYTDKSGVIVFENVTPGTLVEIKGDDGIPLNEQRIQISRCNCQQRIV